MAQKKLKSCWCCRSVNCYIKQKLSSKHKIQKRYALHCTGRQITFSELKEQIKNKEASPAESNAASANVKPPTIANYDSYTSESDNSDSWGSMLINAILVKSGLISGEKSNNRNINQEHQLIEKVSLEDSESMDNKYNGENLNDPVEKVS